jgi:NAD(P)-dependent dehydrogenase (short-subunit alcohol dehydrogenase family)
MPARVRTGSAPVRRTGRGQLNIPVNNFGISGIRGRSEDIDLEEWDLGMRVSLTPVVLMIGFAACIAPSFVYSRRLPEEREQRQASLGLKTGGVG